MTELKIKDQTPHIAKHVLGDCASSEVYLMDCIDGMKHYPDKYFDLACIDPPYGINADLNQLELANKKGFTKGAGTYKEYHKTNWDAETPDDAFFIELMRVSKIKLPSFV